VTKPSQCPRCGSYLKYAALCKCWGVHDPWHDSDTPASQPALRPPSEPRSPVNDSYDDNARMAAPQAPTYCQICGGIGGHKRRCPNHPAFIWANEDGASTSVREPKITVSHGAPPGCTADYWPPRPTPVREGAAAEEFWLQWRDSEKGREVFTQCSNETISMVFAREFAAYQNAALRQQLERAQAAAETWEYMRDQVRDELESLRKERDALREALNKVHPNWARAALESTKD
jgi:hypothetical protein